MTKRSLGVDIRFLFTISFLSLSVVETPIAGSGVGFCLLTRVSSLRVILNIARELRKCEERVYGVRHHPEPWMAITHP